MIIYLISYLTAQLGVGGGGGGASESVSRIMLKKEHKFCHFVVAYTFARK